MIHEYYLSDVFTGRVFGGNPLAVFPHADDVPDALMPQIARELNLSETVFVKTPADPKHAARIRIFTPRMELPFAGHPTVGTACTLLRLGMMSEGDSVIVETVGPIAVRARKEGDRFFAEFTARQTAEVREEVPDRATLAQLLSIDVADILYDSLRPLAVSAGVAFTVVPVRNADVLARTQLNQAAWTDHLSTTWAPHVYVVAENSASSIRVRMFAPAMGIAEDPATGGAAAALPAYLDVASNGRTTSQTQWQVEQGFELGRPSLIDVTAIRESGKLAGVKIGGETVFVGKGMISQ
jgi:trans-2,3-dihydro-3-hydroxyanthranilate isomerase